MELLHHNTIVAEHPMVHGDPTNINTAAGNNEYDYEDPSPSLTIQMKTTYKSLPELFSIQSLITQMSLYQKYFFI